MSFSYEERNADSPFVQTVWRTFNETDGCYTALADGNWDFLVFKQQGRSCLFLTGPMTKATPIPYREGVECLGIRFKLGTFIPQLPNATLLDVTSPLPKATGQTFWLHDTMLTCPDFETVETFVEKLERESLIARNTLVEAVLEEQEPPVSQRSVQRHFLKTTGLTFKAIRQIQRAWAAAELLESGVSIQDTIYKLDYFDQSHLTKALKHFIGRTPTQILHSSNP